MSDDRLTYKAQPKYNKYTSLNTSRGIILNEIIMNEELKDVSLDVPKPLRTRTGRKYQSKYCCYHWTIGHDTNDSFQLKNAIEILIHRGKLDIYVQGWGGNYKPWYEWPPCNEQQERSRRPDQYQRRGCFKECSPRHKHRTLGKEVETHVQNVHHDGS